MATTKQPADIRLRRTDDPDIMTVERRRHPDALPVEIGRVAKDGTSSYVALGAMGDRIPGIWPTRRSAVNAVRRLDVRLAGI